MQALTPVNESKRLKALLSYHILDSEDDSAFDDIALMASTICGTPIAAISLIDEHRQWFKSITGLSVKETHRNMAFCAHTILQNDIMTVPDALADNRFIDNELVTDDPHIRFYAGAPLITSENLAMGTLCVIDYIPRELNDDQRRSLQVLARHATMLIEMRRHVSEFTQLLEKQAEAQEALATSEGKFRTAINSMQEGVVVQDENGSVTLANQQAEEILGLTSDQFKGRTSYDLRWQCITENFEELPGSQHPSILTLTDGKPRKGFVMGIHKPSGELRWISVNSSLVEQAELGVNAKKSVITTFVDITDQKRNQFEMARLASVVEHSEDAIITINLDGIVTSWNVGAQQLYGYTPDEMIGAPISSTATSIEVNNSVVPAWKRLRDGEMLPPFDAQRRAKDGTIIDVSIRLSPIRDTAHQIIGISGVIRDIRDQKRTLEQLRRSEEILSEAQTLARLGCWDYDIEHDKIIWSDEMYRITGRQKSDGAPTIDEYKAMLHPEDRDTMRLQFTQALETGHGYDAERRLVRADGEVIWTHSRTNAEFRDGKAIRMYGTILDISESKRAEQDIADFNVALHYQMEELRAANERLEELSTTDALTSLKNHRAFQERFSDETKRSARHNKEFALLMIDVDRFKDFNDTFGHPAGDDVLKHVGRIIAESVRETDLAARYGGEEFVVILPETGSQGALTIANRILHGVADFGWTKRSVTVSIGCATSSNAKSDLLECADRALYHSKANGRNQVTSALELRQVA